MAANALTVPLATDVVGHLEKRLQSSLQAFVEEWSESASALTRWEDEHLLDNPNSDLLQRHKATIDQLIRIGKQLSLITAEPDFPNHRQHAVITATLQMLQDKRVMWHGTMGEKERQRIVDVCFP